MAARAAGTVFLGAQVGVALALLQARDLRHAGGHEGRLLDELLELGVTLGQGWLYGRPSPDIPPTERVTVRVPRKLDPTAISRLLVKGN